MAQHREQFEDPADQLNAQAADRNGLQDEAVRDLTDNSQSRGWRSTDTAGVPNEQQITNAAKQFVDDIRGASADDVINRFTSMAIRMDGASPTELSRELNKALIAGGQGTDWLVSGSSDGTLRLHRGHSERMERPEAEAQFYRPMQDRFDMNRDSNPALLEAAAKQMANELATARNHDDVHNAMLRAAQRINDGNGTPTGMPGTFNRVLQERGLPYVMSADSNGHLELHSKRVRYSPFAEVKMSPDI